MTTYNPLRSGVDALTAAAIQTLTSAGYAWNPKTTSFSSYLAAALGGINGKAESDKFKSVPRLLSDLVNALGAGPVTYLNTGVDQLLALIAGAGSQAPVLWTPADLGASLVAWWDANQGVVLSGSSVTSWTDRQSGIVASGGVSPAFSATARNSKPGLTFNGSQYLAFTPAFPINNQARSISIAGFASATGTFAFSYGGNSATHFLSVLCNDPIDAYDGISVGPAAENWNGVDRFASLGMDGSGGATWNIDGSADEAFSFSTITTNATGFIGSYIVAGTSPWNGVIQQIVFANRALTASEKAKMAGWESWYDGKAGSNLPIGSPYKSRAPYVTDDFSLLSQSSPTQQAILANTNTPIKVQ